MTRGGAGRCPPVDGPGRLGVRAPSRGAVSCTPTGDSDEAADAGRVGKARGLLRRLRVVLLRGPADGRAALPMATPVKTLDALHLASALLWRERRAAELSFATHDPQQARAARALGFDCIGV